MTMPIKIMPTQGKLQLTLPLSNELSIRSHSDVVATHKRPRSRQSAAKKNGTSHDRSLEEQLIEMKMELASAMSREDYLVLQIRRLMKQTEDQERENRELKMQLKKSLSMASEQRNYVDITLVRGNNKENDFPSRQHHVPRVLAAPIIQQVPTKNPENKSIEATEARLPPSVVRLAYMDKSNSVSMLSFHSAFSSDVNCRTREEEKEPEAIDQHRYRSVESYYVPLRDGVQGNDEKIVGMPHPVSCASGLAFLTGDFSGIDELSVRQECISHCSRGDQSDDFDDGLYVN
mmetsp:Transcript_16751/g.34987  ORF Transcript_16751/g.34987 Transcript_16751/m.34987 type:complete len:289 (+) Transcript_16751:92-958(+)